MHINIRSLSQKVESYRHFKTSDWARYSCSYLLTESCLKKSISGAEEAINNFVFKQRNRCTAALRKALTTTHSFTSPFHDPSKFGKDVKSISRNNSSCPTHISYGHSPLTGREEICTAFKSHFAASGHLVWIDLYPQSTGWTRGYYFSTKLQYVLL